MSGAIGTTRPPDFWNLYATKALGMPEGWRWFSLSAKDGPPKSGRRYVEMKGAVPPGYITRGKNKGYPNWRGFDTKRVPAFLVDFDEFQAFIKSWEVETGCCEHCGDTGKRVVSAGMAGVTYGACTCSRGRSLEAA